MNTTGIQSLRLDYSSELTVYVLSLCTSMRCFYHQRAVQRIVQGVCSEYSFGVVTIVFNINTAELSWVARQRLGDGKISPSEVQQRCDIARD